MANRYPCYRNEKGKVIDNMELAVKRRPNNFLQHGPIEVNIPVAVMLQGQT